MMRLARLLLYRVAPRAAGWAVAEHPVGSELGLAELAAVGRVVLSRRSLSFGSDIERFERRFGEVVAARHAVALSSGSAALALAAQLLRLGAGDEVVATTQTFRATILPFVARGVRLRFADTDAGGLDVDPAAVRAAITERTRAVLVTHHGGVPAALDALRAICRERHVALVEDCAHALGATFDGQPIGGSDGGGRSICCFSFGSLKNITTLGEGGMLCTDNARWADEARALRGWGVLARRRTPREPPQIGRYRRVPDVYDHAGESWDVDLDDVEEVGCNRRMSIAAAAVGLAQLRRLDGLLARRRHIAARYDEAIATIDGLRVRHVDRRAAPARHLYTCLVDPDRVDRDQLLQALQREHGVRLYLRYLPLHLSALMRARGHRLGECPNAERVFFEELVELPLSARMSRFEVAHVIAALRAASASATRR
ncbi:MAG: aminotransferase class V-fold PLP-dependent enzyme [Myxococcales bacterium]|nr:aminotransferase class V-fold PLP-dependent enzyme [Myxococcales bacterium]